MDDTTLTGSKLTVYVLLKVLKNCTNSKANSFQIKFAVDTMLMGEDTDKMGMGAAIRLVMRDTKIRGKFDSIHPDLEKEGYSGVEVTDEGFKFVRKNEGL